MQCRFEETSSRRWFFDWMLDLVLYMTIISAHKPKRTRTSISMASCQYIDKLYSPRASKESFWTWRTCNNTRRKLAANFACNREEEHIYASAPSRVHRSKVLPAQTTSWVTVCALASGSLCRHLRKLHILVEKFGFLRQNVSAPSSWWQNWSTCTLMFVSLREPVLEIRPEILELSTMWNTFGI